jgi:hypothetical protein
MDTVGPKTRAFYYNIVTPNDHRHVTIDGHMYGIYVGKRIVMKGVALLKFPYHEVEQTFKQIARKHHMIPNQLQAILWFT